MGPHSHLVILGSMITLGQLANVINGPGPIMDDDEDEEAPFNPAMGNRMSMINPMMPVGGPLQMSASMGFGTSPAWGGPWAPQQGPVPSMLSPAQFMAPPTDPNFFAAHQQAMLYAKQAYQMAVAQQALAAAGEEWERGSSVGFGGSSVFGGSTAGFGMGMGGQWGSPPMFSGGPRSVYGGFSGTHSEYGGGVGGGGTSATPTGGWSSSKSVYGETFGPSGERTRTGRSVTSGYFGSGPIPPLPQSGGNGTGRGSRVRTSSVPISTIGTPGKSGPARNTPPPSSWRGRAPGP